MAKTKLTIQYVLCALVVLAMALTSCNIGRPTEVLEEGGNIIPTPIAGENVGEAPGSQAAATPEETASRYLKDSLGSLVAQQTQKIELRERYQNPSQTVEDLGGLLTEISVLEDRTEVKKVNENSTNATANVDLDVRVTWADGDTESFTCKYAVTLQQAENDDEEEVWYVINPDAFPLFVNCSRK
jgi:hypothetical protein